MFDNIFKNIWFIGWLIYLLGIYTPRMRRKRESVIVLDRSRGVDIAHDMLVFLVWQVIPFIYVVSSWLDFADYHLPTWAGWIGVPIFAGSLLLIWRAYADLGSNWTPKIEIQKGQTLVTGGIFRYIRHPTYAGMFLWGIAQPLLLHNWIAGWGLLVIFIPLYILRVPREEQMMLEHFRKKYRDYMKQTGRVIPRIGK